MALLYFLASPVIKQINPPLLSIHHHLRLANLLCRNATAALRQTAQSEGGSAESNKLRIRKIRSVRNNR